MSVSTKVLDEALAKIVTSGEIEAAAPALSLVLDRLEQAVTRRVFQRLRSGETLDPQFAVQCWMELFANARVRSSLTKGIAVGQSAGETISEQMDNGE